jgi:hypothetical protein
MFGTIFEKLKSTLYHREKSLKNDLNAIAKKIAIGEEPPIDQVVRILAESGKSDDDLQALAELHQRRELMRVQFAAIPRLRAEQKEVERQHEKNREAFEAARQQYEQASLPLRGQADLLRQQLQEGDKAAHQLIATCPDEELTARYTELTSEHAATRTQSHQLREKVSTERERAKNEITKAEHSPQSEAHERRMRAKTHSEQAAAFDAQLTETLKRIPEIEQEIQRVTVEMSAC